MKRKELLQSVIDLGMRPTFSITPENLIEIETYNNHTVAYINDVAQGQYIVIGNNTSLLSIVQEYAKTPLKDREERVK